MKESYKGYTITIEFDRDWQDEYYITIQRESDDLRIEGYAVRQGRPKEVMLAAARQKVDEHLEQAQAAG